MINLSKTCLTARHLGRSTSGNVAVTFALSLTPLILLLGLALDVAQAHRYRSMLQSAADGAALEAVEISANGGSIQDATAAGQSAWATALAPVLPAGSSIPTLNLTVQNQFDLATATATCAMPVATNFASAVGMGSITVNCSTQAQSYVNSVVHGGFTGAGGVWGDPHVVAADGADYYVACDTGNWYDLIADRGIEVNVACQPWGGSGPSVITSFSVMIGGHNYVLTYPNDAINQVGWGVWYGYDPVFSVDGQQVANPGPDTLSYQSGAVTYGKSQFGDWEQGIYQNMYTLTVTTPQYTLAMSFPYGGNIQVTVRGAGLCGTPNGFWGQTLSGNNVSDTSQFIVSGPTATVAPYGDAPCTQAMLGPHLTQ